MGVESILEVTDRMTDYSEVTILRSSDDVLKYWFGSNYFEGGSASRNDVDYIKSRMPLWFGRADPVFDAIQSNNSDLLLKLEQIHNTEEDWNTFPGLMAKIIVFDQFARSVFRGTAKAFQYDGYTKETVECILSRNWFFEYSAIERLFIIVALQHYESMEAQTIGVGLGKQIIPFVRFFLFDIVAATITDGITENHDALSDYFKNLKGFPHEHHDVIKQFGRFPGRNDALVSKVNLYVMFIIVLI